MLVIFLYRSFEMLPFSQVSDVDALVRKLIHFLLIIIFSQSVIIDMRAMLNNAIKGDYNAESDPTVSRLLWNLLPSVIEKSLLLNCFP